MNILFVCTGNTCRSPMAAVLMDKLARERKLDIRIESAGLAAPEGAPASENAAEAMRDYGVDLTRHRAKNVTAELLDQCDLILTMGAAHKAALDKFAPGRVFTLAEFAGASGDIRDPYGGDLETYKKCAEDIYGLLENAADKLPKIRDDD